MNIVTSQRPMADDVEIGRNQSLAKRSWEMCARRIVYFGPNEFELRSPKTVFVDCEPFPRIKTLIGAAASMVGYTAILNADIVVKPDILRLERMMGLRGKLCASSRRYHFDPATCNWDAAELGDDRGRDLFMARHDVWKRAVKEVPEMFRIGHQGWDGWLTDFLRRNYNDSFMDFTAKRIVFHPIHGSRRMPHAAEVATIAGIH